MQSYRAKQSPLRSIRSSYVSPRAANPGSIVTIQDRLLLRQQRQQEINQLLKEKEEQIASLGNPARFNFKSCTRVERKMQRSAVEPLQEKVFIKRNKLVLFIDNSKENLISYKKCISKVEFVGTAIYQRSA